MRWNVKDSNTIKERMDIALDEARWTDTHAHISVIPVADIIKPIIAVPVFGTAGPMGYVLCRPNGGI